ncbi:anthranilate synthase component I family protein [Acaryochloris marina]|uniref:Chorismate binding domain protein n=1 Tax=Acaryochloris marina (strain MBIC 11017) TaxID=329726 RepID=A8ZKP9_ACAM1|nr:chorismate-binding protein [Acaryochloris marina]ABW31367.1 chorismate binding domain protein [Acaryochloris marina MBIC11017]
MVTELHPTITYQETFVPGKRSEIATLKSCLDAGLFSNYMLYKKDGDVRIAGNELATISVSPDVIQLQSQGQSHTEPATDPFQQVGALLKTLAIKNWTAYGYVAFDMARFYSSYSKSIQQPLLHFLVPETELQFTHAGVHVKRVGLLDPLLKILESDRSLADYQPIPLEQDAADCEPYSHKIKTLIAAIQQNELHKAIISRSKKLTGDLDLIGTYAVGVKNNNSARSYCFKLADVGAVGFSPEILMEVNQAGMLVTNPLAATRPRGKDHEADQQLENELFTDAKEVKEHALSIWLAQSELDSVCIPQTVKVFNFMEVKKYRCVQHLSSRVGGQLQTGKTLWDALKVIFPGVTVTGINKSQALDWIDQLESEPRGIYAGGIGWVDSKGMADLAIAIRSVYQYCNTICLNAGAGIVAESNTQNEYVESVNKMNTMLTSLVLK